AEAIPLPKGKSITAAQLLEQFLFPPATHRQQAATLSGGEKRRLYLLTILMKNPNFLILDEPTNDLDIATIAVLEEYLQNFPGCLLVVSHDRYFMDKLTQHLFVLDKDFRDTEEGVITDFLGNYSDYLAAKEAKSRQAIQQEKEELRKERKPKERPKQITFAQKKERDQLEKEIPMLEARLESLNAEMQAGGNFEKISELGRSIDELQKEKESKTPRFLELLELPG
ncbi:MAG TPA: ATP-binding cassette domain-containing protein, partial [Turneriella sp.]|nr:ATP-binding cassette domain-containing protein [Turneriella sp.]